MLDRIVFAGASRTIESILDRVVHLAPVLVLDTSQAALDELPLSAASPAESATASSIRPIIGKRLGDATSRFVLEEARGEPQHTVALVAATGDDRRNLEVCRLARELQFNPVVGIVIDPARAEEYEALGARAIVRAQILGNVVEQALRYDGMVIASSVGQGRGEIIEFVVLPSSPAIGVPLSQLQAAGWRIAAIYRHGDLVIPTGDTAIAAEDRVLVIGDPEILSHVAEQLRIGVPQFPLRYGSSLLVYLPASTRDVGAVDREALQLLHGTRAQTLVRMAPGLRPDKKTVETQAQAGSTQSPRHHLRTLEDQPLDGADLVQHRAQFRQRRPGLVVLEKPRRGLLNRMLGRPGLQGAVCNSVSCPVLFASGRKSYARVVLPLQPGITDLTLADAAIDLSRMLSLPLCLVRVKLPAFLEAPDKADERVAAEIIRRSRLYGLRVEEVQAEGNPVRELLRLLRADDLCVVARRRSTRDSFTSPDVALRLLSAPGSCLVHTLSSRGSR
jgi:hypothetical protein